MTTTLQTMGLSERRHTLQYLVGCILNQCLHPQQAGLATAGAVLAGHFFPVFWRFKGGTGLVVGMGASLGFLPLGAVIAVPFTVAFAKFSKDMGQAGGVFIVTATIAGGLVHRDLFSVVAVLLIGLAIGIKSWMQYNHWHR